LGRTPPPGPAAPADRPGLTDDARQLLEKLLSAEHVKTDLETRWGHTAATRLLTCCDTEPADTTDMPAAVVYPGSHDDVQALLIACDEQRIVVVPYAGGTSVVGGLAPQGTAFIAVDLADSTG